MVHLKREQTLLIGYGSIGKRHATSLLPYSNLLVYDANKILDLPEGYLQLPNLEEQTLRKNDIDRVIIATWGPSHASILENCLTAGIGKIMIEKPIASRIEDLDVMERACLAASAKIVSNFHLRYLLPPKLIQELRNRYSLGEICFLSVNGGARCLATNGIHYLDLAIQLFASAPEGSYGFYQDGYCNPRHPNLAFLQGNLVWQFGESNYLSISFHNESRANESVSIFFEDGLLEVTSDSISLRKNPKPYRGNESKTRTVDFDKVVFRQSISVQNGIPATLLKLHRDWYSDDYSLLGSPFLATRHFLMALIDNAPAHLGNTDLASYDWMIS